MTGPHSNRFVVLSLRSLDDPNLGRAALRVLVALSSNQAEGEWFSISQSSIAKRLGHTRRAVARQISALEELSYIDVRREKGPDDGCLVNRHRLIGYATNGL